MKILWTIFAAYTICWGLWIGNPFWTVFSEQAAIYSKMAAFMPEWAWGINAVLVGIAMLVGARWQWPRALMWGYMAGCYHWSVIAVFYGLGDWHNTGMITAAFLVLMLRVLWDQSIPIEVHPLAD